MTAIEIAESMRKQARLLDRVAEILDPIDEAAKRLPRITPGKYYQVPKKDQR